MFAYGPVMLHEALLAYELLAERGVGLKVVNMPWLNRIDTKWLLETTQPYSLVFVLEDHHPAGGLGDHMLALLAEHRSNPLARRRVVKFAVQGWPACGTPAEALQFHRLDGASLAERVLEACD